MQQGTVADLDAALALSAAKISHEMKIPMAAGIILATARARGAAVWIQDVNLKGLDRVQSIAKQDG